LIEDGQEYSLLGRAVPFDRPVRLLHGMRDRDVPWLHSVRIAEFLAGTDVRLTLVKDGDHRLSTPSNLDLLTGSVAELSGAAA
jgi:pimeloyl-ACP methyl ester carboxylesterase